MVSLNTLASFALLDKDRRRGEKVLGTEKGRGQGPEGDFNGGRLGMMRKERDCENGNEGGWMREQDITYDLCSPL